MWLLDADISLANGFDLRAFLRARLVRGVAPLIVAPAIRQNTQSYWPCNWYPYAQPAECVDSHIRCNRTTSQDCDMQAACPQACGACTRWGRLTKLRGLMAPVDIIEMQAPLLDLSFFNYIMAEVGVQLERRQWATLPNNSSSRDVTDWGIDLLWCGAGRDYLESRMLAKGTRPACGIVAVPVDHLDSRTISKSSEFLASGYRVLEFAKNTWPQWFDDGVASGYSQWQTVRHRQRVEALALRILDRASHGVR